MNSPLPKIRKKARMFIISTLSQHGAGLASAISQDRKMKDIDIGKKE